MLLLLLLLLREKLLLLLLLLLREKLLLLLLLLLLLRLRLTLAIGLSRRNTTARVLIGRRVGSCSSRCFERTEDSVSVVLLEASHNALMHFHHRFPFLLREPELEQVVRAAG